ncbi:MAG: phosphoesterase [Deltaproteobacteria bacterium RIFOXYD12_FULL_57_12]|nr:MAG: phosphoesterase [Deltaproteobacteria bacterium RIFOXYD12_FULL_57_12]
MKKSDESLGRIVAELKGKKNVLVATHVFPDGDALGSQLAMGNILEGMGKKVFYYSEERISHLYDYMPGCEKLESRLPKPAVFDAIISLDCGDCFRLGEALEDLREIHPFVVIDHHSGHKEFGDLRWIDPNRSSTGEMVYELAVALGADISYEAAFCLFTAIVADTGSFKYDCTTASTFRVAGELVDLGVKPYDVARKLFDNYTTGRLRLLEAVLGTLEMHADGQIAIITVTQEMFARTGAKRDDTEDFINYPRALNTVKVAIFIKEGIDGWIGVSMRAKGECDVAQLAMTFGGGGHRNAAGYRLQGSTIAAVRTALLPELLRRLAAKGL